MTKTALPVPGSLAELWKNLITAAGGTPSTPGSLDELMQQFANALLTYPGGGSAGVGPANNVGQTMSRAEGSESETIAVSSGDLYLASVNLPVNTVVNNINFVVGSTASSGVSHNWAVLTNSARVPLAISADNTTTDLTANTAASYAIANTAAGAGTSFTTTYSGIHYMGFMIATGTTQPTMFGNTGAAATVNAIAPIAGGLSSTTQTTPTTLPASAYTAITASASVLYGYLT